MTISPSTSTFATWNSLDRESAVREILPCCGSHAWAEQLADRRPIDDAQQLLDASDRIWAALPEEDWREAFDSHPRIGQQHARAASSKSLAWSAQEQSAAMSEMTEEEASKLALADANRCYEERFGRIFIVCASGRSAKEILSILNARMNNSPAVEWREAGEQQRQITQLRLRRRLGED